MFSLRPTAKLSSEEETGEPRQAAAKVLECNRETLLKCCRASFYLKYRDGQKRTLMQVEHQLESKVKSELYLPAVTLFNATRELRTLLKFCP